MLPSLFVAHGSPMLAVEHSEYAKFLGELPLMFARPRAIALPEVARTALTELDLTGVLDVAPEHLPSLLVAGSAHLQLGAYVRAEEALREKVSKIEQAEALAELARAAAQLKVIERLRKLRG